MTGPHLGDAQEPDLDALIGELLAEGARRRAEPGYPHEAAAELELELARRAPVQLENRSIPELLALVRESVAALGRAAEAASPTGDGRSRARPTLFRRTRQMGGAARAPWAQRGRRARRQDVDSAPAVLTFALALVEVIRGLAEAVDALRVHPERRLPSVAAGGGGSGAGRTSVALARWRDGLAELLARSGRGRVLYGDEDAAAVVAELRGAGIDAYGVGGAEAESADVRSGEVADHLHSVGDRTLEVVVLAGAPDRLTSSSFLGLAEQLARTSATVIVLSESPSSWRARLGSESDLTEERPFGPETWMSVLEPAGYLCTAAYDDEGRTYRLVARRR